MKTVDAKNSLIINRLAKKYFSLTNKSQRLFTHRLLYERDIPKEYADVLKGSEDLRARFDLSDEFLQDFDSSWSMFSDVFCEYVDKRNITYKNYSRNKVIVNKNEKKIVKDMTEFYTNVFENWLYDREDIDIFESFIPVYGYYYFEDLKYTIKTYIRNLKDFRTSFDTESSIVDSIGFAKNFLGEQDFTGVEAINFKGTSFTLEEALTELEIESLISHLKKNLHDFISRETRRRFNSITERKPFANKELQLVISLNYADWLMASTGDSWSSCISLFSTYDECFWTGLPTLIGDKSRAMVYITEKGAEKKNFAGIKVDKFLARTWMQIYRTIPPKIEDGKREYEKSKTFFLTVKSYPIELSNMNKVLENFMTIPSATTVLNSDDGHSKIVSKYYAENLWFEENSRGLETFTTIYLDDGSFKMARKNKAKYFPGEYGYYKLNGGGQAFRFQRTPEGIIQSADDFLASGMSFAEIMDERSSILNEMEKYFNGYHRDYDELEDEEEDDYYEDEWNEEEII